MHYTLICHPFLIPMFRGETVLCATVIILMHKLCVCTLKQLQGILKIEFHCTLVSNADQAPLSLVLALVPL